MSSNVTAPPLELPPGITLHNTIGALEIGTVFSIILFGIASLQALQYFTSGEKDALWLKGMVSRSSSDAEHLRDSPF